MPLPDLFQSGADTTGCHAQYELRRAYTGLIGGIILIPCAIALAIGCIMAAAGAWPNNPIGTAISIIGALIMAGTFILTIGVLTYGFQQAPKDIASAAKLDQQRSRQRHRNTTEPR